MSVITRRLSVPELSQQVLTMAKAGVYRESVFEALQPLATKKQIRAAIAHAKHFGLHSVADLRDAELGTYYQVDLVKYQSLQHAIAAPVTLGNHQDLMTRLTDATQAVQRVLAIARGFAIGFGVVGVVCLLSDRDQIGFGCLSAAIGATTIWLAQRTLTQKLPLQ